VQNLLAVNLQPTINHQDHHRRRQSKNKYMDVTNLYLSLAAQHSLDAQQKQRVQDLAAFSDMLTALTTNTLVHNAEMDKMADSVCMASSTIEAKTAIPFDSPFDQSLGSPASTRDYHQSPLQDFDFSTSIDAPLFPEHGTQQSMHSDNLLAGLPLFGNELALSQTLDNAEATGATMSSLNAIQDVPASDFSFDALASNMTAYEGNLTDDLVAFNNPITTALEQSYDSNNGIEFLNEASDSFVRACTRLKMEQGVDGLQQALRSAGWNVDANLAASIASTAESLCSRSPSPSLASSQDSAAYSPQTNGSVSPMILPSSAATVAPGSRKVRSSIQSSRTSVVGHSGQRNYSTKRFVCPDCDKWFDRAFNLRTHSLTHVAPNDREKPYSCPWTQCNKPFSRKYDAERHYRTVHVKRGEHASDEEVEMALSGHRACSDVDAANG
jgi:hypothetical protein